MVRAFDNAMRWQKNCRLSRAPFSKLDVLKVISCYSHVVNAIDAGDTKRGLKGVRASRIKSERGAMRGFHNSSFDPQTLALIETRLSTKRG